MTETEISVVIPAYNEEKNVVILYDKLKEVLDEIGKRYEVVFIDDGSEDNTFENLKKIHEEDERVKVIRFRRNFRKSAALMAGFREAEGELVFTMDADLQDDPREIPKFIDKIKGGYDMVSGWKFNRKDPITKTLPSKIFNWLTSKLTGVKVHDSNCGFKCYRKEAVKNLDLYGELYRYIPALAYWKGFKVGEIKVVHHARKFGKSKFGFSRLFRGFFDLITVKYLTTYNRRPLHLFGMFGLLFMFLGFISGSYLVYLKFLGKSIGDRPLLFLTVLLIFLGVQFLSIGLLGEMIASQYSKKDYLIGEKLK